jgi:magnesium transporter
MHTRHEHKGLVWVDLESPSRDEVQDIVDEFGIEPLVAQELLLPSSKPRAEFYPEHIYLVLHFPALRHTHKSREQEVDLIVGKRYLITAHYDTIDPLHKFSKVFEVNSLLERGVLGEHAGFLLFSMMKKLYKAVEHEVEYIRHDQAVIEEHIFSGHEVAMVSTISRAARDLLNLRQVIEPHREILRELEAGGARFFGEDFAPYLRAISDEYYRVHNHITRETESLHELRETNNSLLSTKQNEVMKTLTVITAITAPLTLITGLFGISSQYIPIIDSPGGFWFVVALMVVTGVLIMYLFKKEHWL